MQRFERRFRLKRPIFLEWTSRRWLRGIRSADCSEWSLRLGPLKGIGGAASRASREYTARLLAHTGVIPGLCDQCQTRPITAHVAYKPMEAPRFAHYCDSCAPGMPHGWLSVTAFN